MTISAGALTIRNTGQVGSPTFGAGNGGNVLINVPGPLNIDGSGNSTQFLTGIAASVQPGSSGNARNVLVNAGSLHLVDGVIFNGAVGALGAAPASTGNGCDINVKVAGVLSINGSGAGVETSTDFGTRGNAGDILVTAGSISLVNGGLIATNTFGTGDDGNIKISAGALTIASNSDIATHLGRERLEILMSTLPAFCR